MAKLSLRRHDVQARISLVLSLAAAVCLLATAGLILQRLDFHMKVIPYRSTGMRMPLIYGSGLAALLLGTLGFGFGVNSVGQRRNDKPVLSWIGFFVGALTITLALVLLFLFQNWKEQLL